MKPLFLCRIRAVLAKSRKMAKSFEGDLLFSRTRYSKKYRILQGYFLELQGDSLEIS